MPDFINVSNEIAKATLLSSGSAVMSPGKSLLADGVVFTSDGRKWEQQTDGSPTLIDLLNTVGREGDIARPSDYKNIPYMYWDTQDNQWRLTSPWSYIEDSTPRSRVSTNTSTDTTKAVLHAIKIPNVLGRHGRIQIRYWYTSSVTTVAKTLAVKFGARELPATPISAGQTGRTSQIDIYCDGSYVSQKMMNSDNPTGNVSNAAYTLTEDTANPVTVTFLGSFSSAVAGEDITIQHLSVTLFP